MTGSGSTVSGQFALDVRSLDKLHHRASEAPREGLEEAATQFEAIFIQTMLKSMRDATPESDLVSTQESSAYRDMMDKQRSQQLAERGIGLAELLTAQLSDRLGDAGQ